MFRLMMLAALFAALACGSEERGDVGAADEPAAEVSGEARVSAVDVALDRESTGAASAPVEVGAGGANDAVVAEKRPTD